MPDPPAKAATRPGAARLLPAEAVRRTVPERAPRQQRFTKTIAELQRYQAATRPSEPWGNVVPRPAVPQSNPQAARLALVAPLVPPLAGRHRRARWPRQRATG